MILRNRFNLAFAAIFGTALAAILLVFIKANAYAKQVDVSKDQNQWAVAVERLRFSVLQKQYDIELARRRWEWGQRSWGWPPDLPRPVWAWRLTPAFGVLHTIAWLPDSTSNVHSLLDSVAATLQRLPEVSIPDVVGVVVKSPMQRTDDALVALRGSRFADRSDVDALSSALQAVAVTLQSRSVNAQREATEIGFSVVIFAASSCVFLVLEFGIFWILVRSWTIHPIMSLASDAQRLHAASPDFRLKVDRRDEIGQLAESLNEMMGRLRERERQLARAREMATVGEICSGVAHGMRNPLAVIRLSAQRFSQSANLSTDQETMLDDIIQQVDRLNDRITRLLRFASSLDPRYEAVRFDWLSSVVVRESMAALSMHDLHIEVSDDTRGIHNLMDPDLTVQAVVECVSNSAHHSPAGSTITLRGSVAEGVNGHGPEWRISIHDQGRGIQPEVMGNIFDLFFTLRENGTGVGLSMVKRIVEQHSGHIEVESPPGQGTTFHLCWPLRSAEAS